MSSLVLARFTFSECHRLMNRIFRAGRIERRDTSGGLWPPERMLTSLSGPVSFRSERQIQLAKHDRIQWGCYKEAIPRGCRPRKADNRSHKQVEYLSGSYQNGGESGIRTSVLRKDTTVFETVPFNRSGNSPLHCLGFGKIPEQGRAISFQHSPEDAGMMVEAFVRQHVVDGTHSSGFGLKRHTPKCPAGSRSSFRHTSNRVPKLHTGCNPAGT